MADTKKFVIDETTWQKLMEEHASYFLRAKENLVGISKSARDDKEALEKGMTIFEMLYTALA